VEGQGHCLDSTAAAIEYFRKVSVPSVNILAIGRNIVIKVPAAADCLAHFSPYPTSKEIRFGDYPAQVNTDSRPIQKHWPVSSVSMAAI
jgi:hypothetical protein